MRFKIGSKVEVLSKKKTPSGFWRPAEIVSDNGDDYTVRYERYLGISKVTIERVKEDIVRPCQPRGKKVANWEVGDIVEVFDDGYWKVSVIEATEGEEFYIRVIGSFDEFKVPKSSIRVRQAWEDNKWAVLDKDSNPCEDLICKALKRTLTQTGCGSPSVQNGISVQEGCYRAPKRAFPNSSANTEACFGNPQKRREVKEDCCSGVEIPKLSSSLTRKVDAAIYIPDRWSQNNCPASNTDRNIAMAEANFAEQNPAKCLNRILEQNDSDSIVSSVGSCSSAIKSSSNRLHTDTLPSDAESCYRTGYEEGRCGLSSKKRYVFRTHRSELDTYRGTLEALYASGPLSWELETYLTDLRAQLRISSDEHLAEVRKLRSFTTGLCVG